MRVIYVAVCLLLSLASAHADKAVVSGKPLILFNAGASNPDCSFAGDVVMRVVEGPNHGRVSIRSMPLYSSFRRNDPRSVCNTRKVRGMRATYVSQRGYVGDDLVVLEVFYPAGRALTVRLPIHVM
jgi:hypothetical protein